MLTKTNRKTRSKKRIKIHTEHSENRTLACTAPDPTDSTDETLLLAVAQRRDVKAFKTLHARFLSHAYSLARNLTASHELAEDIVQEAMLAMWSSSATYQPERGSAKNWILRIVANKAILMGRRQLADRNRADKREPRDDFQPSETTSSEQNELQALLRKRLVSLGAEHRKLIALYFGAGLSQDEIAKQLCVSQRRISLQIRKILARLRSDLKKAGYSRPLVWAPLLSETVTSGWKAAPSLSESILKRFDCGQLETLEGTPSGSTSGSLAAKLSMLAGVLALGFAGAHSLHLINVHVAPTPQRPEALPKSAAPALEDARPKIKTWDFNSADSGQDLDFMSGGWTWQPDGGLENSGCVVNDSPKADAFLRIPLKHLPAKITYRWKVKARYDQWRNYTTIALWEHPSYWMDFSGFMKNANSAENNQPWFEFTLFVTQTSIDTWVRYPHQKEGSRAGLSLCARRGPSGLILYRDGPILFDHLTLETIEPEQLPDLSEFKALFEKYSKTAEPGAILPVPELAHYVRSHRPIYLRWLPPGTRFLSQEPKVRDAKPNPRFDAPGPKGKRSWTFESERSIHTRAAKKSGWAWSPKGGSNQSGCLRTSHQTEVHQLEIPLRSLPAKVTYRWRPDLQHKQKHLAIALVGWSESLACFNFKGFQDLVLPGHEKAWAEMSVYVTRNSIDHWAGCSISQKAHRSSVWLGSPAPNAQLKIFAQGPIFLDNLVVEEVAPSALPDVSEFFAAAQNHELEKNSSAYREVPELARYAPSSGVIEMAWESKEKSWLRYENGILTAVVSSLGNINRWGYRRSWTFNRPETLKSLNLLDPSWKWSPHQGHFGSGCLHNRTEGQGPAFQIPLEGTPQKISFRWRPDSSVRQQGHWGASIFWQHPRYRARFSGFSQSNDVKINLDPSLGPPWIEVKVYVTPGSIDQWIKLPGSNQWRREMFSLTRPHENTALIMYRTGPLFMDSLKMEGIEPDEIPKINAFVQVMKKYEHTTKPGVACAIPELATLAQPGGNVVLQWHPESVTEKPVPVSNLEKAPEPPAEF